MDLTAEDAGNLLKLIARVQITGQEATPVAILQQKLLAIQNAPLPEGGEPLTQPAGTPEDVVNTLEDKPKKT